MTQNYSKMMNSNANSNSALPILSDVLNHWGYDLDHLLKYINQGRDELFKEAGKLGLRTDKASLTLVHPWSDIWVEAVILCIPSYNYPDEIKLKSVAHHFSHYYDDHVDRMKFDNDDIVNQEIVNKLRKNHQDIDQITDVLGNLGELCKIVAAKSRNSEGVLKAVQRLTYGGLIQQADSYEFQKKCLNEHMEFALRDLDSDLNNSIRKKINSATFLTTCNAIQELLHAYETKLDFNLCEIENLLAGPGMFYFDISREIEREKFKFFNGLEPSIHVMKDMIKIFEEYLPNYVDSRKLERFRQAKFFYQTLKNVIPSELHEAYLSAIENYQRVTT